MTALSRSTLAQIPVAAAVPAYDFSAVNCGIVHFGVGAFHRSHQAMYVDRLLAAGHLDWALCGIGVMESDRKIRDVLDAQDHLYTLVTVDPDGSSEARVIGSIADVMFAPDERSRVLDLLSSPSTRIVSLTITEAGYGVDDSTGDFDPHDEGVLRDLADLTSPSSVFGYLTVALARRRSLGIAPFTVMSCDNISHNGSVARTALTGFARHHDPDLAEWIDAEVAFPNSMVDRITPVTTADVVQDVRQDHGIDDAWPVRSESFSQWVLEDVFSAGRPPFDTVGVHLVSDVEPYENMKLRLLNASHQVMSHLGLLAGFTYVHEALADPALATFVESYMRSEAVPTLGLTPGIDVSGYIDDLLRRFSSLAVRDTLARQTVDASARIPKFLVPVIRTQLVHDRSIDHAALTLAAWCSTYAGGTASIVDARSAQLQRLSWADHDNPGAFLDNPAVFGDLTSSPRLRGSYQRAQRLLQDLGPLGAAAAVSDRT